ncbi:MAG: Asp-tRNA(Asn)/Glu-tRNA(Gln) amidotransferase subunit GatA [Firmicutes bacterium]|jgi:aspartyl-tRNA(Asn)/glutamyl-tRNA(Gln) amidotransferase subunit A|nr:Asp-tRNA(Asn)/Glu-tRNA(Gln) amidotransferase subunit GatA [Bacillota bacterium]
MKLCEYNALELSRLMKRKEISAVDVVNSFLVRIERMEKKIKAFISLSPDDALETARQVDSRRVAGEELHPLAGVPVAVKDNICTRGISTTCASNVLKKYIPPYDATVVKKLREAGLPILGKTNMDEFAMGSSTENSAFFPTHNPWDVEKAPGGSSGGSAAAVAAHEAPLALGSDTGGSVRQPAAFCGLFGLRPTYGCISRYGLLPLSSSMDQVGILGANVADGAALFHLLAGYDPHDSTTLVYHTAGGCRPGTIEKKISDMTVGVIRGQKDAYFDEEVAGRLDQTATYLQDLGAEITEVSFSHADYALAVYYLINTVEASSNLGHHVLRYGIDSGNGSHFSKGVPSSGYKGPGMEVKRRIILGTYLLRNEQKENFYSAALKVRALIRDEMRCAFRHCDLLLEPTAPTTAFKIGEKVHDPLQMYASDICTIMASLAGFPAVSVFAGLSEGNLPVGMQFTAPPMKEELLFQVATAVEKLYPPLTPPEPK